MPAGGKKKVDVAKRMQWWTDARFGMFIHWGLYAIPARGEWIMHQERIPKDEYAKLADKFNPRKFDANAWVKLAKHRRVARASPKNPVGRAFYCSYANAVDGWAGFSAEAALPPRMRPLRKATSRLLSA